MRVDMHGNMGYLVCKLPKFVVEIKYFYKTSHGISTSQDFDCPCFWLLGDLCDTFLQLNTKLHHFKSHLLLVTMELVPLLCLCRIFKPKSAEISSTKCLHKL